jgi:hypothetical protein
MGLTLDFGMVTRPRPPDHAHHRLTARMNVDMLNRHLLLAFGRPPGRPGAGPVTEVHRPRGRQAVDVVGAPAYDPEQVMRRSVRLSRTGAATPRRLFDHLVGGRQQRHWDGDVERLGGLQVDGQLVFTQPAPNSAVIGLRSERQLSEDELPYTAIEPAAQGIASAPAATRCTRRRPTTMRNSRSCSAKATILAPTATTET